jgi:sulfur relay (sulfurtransferase) complex TusBCD TusD component (DsrE family)
MRAPRVLVAALLVLGTAAVATQLTHSTTVLAQSKETVFVNLTSDEPQRVTMALNFATKLVQGGNKVTLFLNVDGVRLASVKWAPLAAQRTELAAYMKAGGAVVVCPHCMQVRNVAAGDLMAGLTMGGEGAAMQAFLSGTRSISY